MKTNNVDLAAFMVLRGLPLIAIRPIRNGRVREFFFEDAAAKPLMSDFWAGGLVSIRAFVRTRVALSRRPIDELLQPVSAGV